MKVTRKPTRFDQLIPNTGSVDTKVGGKLALPYEFDTNELAGQWSKKGADVDAARGPQPVVGTEYSARGWDIWKYPNEVPDGLDDNDKPEKKKHDKAGQAHEVTLSDGTYVLLCRPKVVQDQVNEAYAEHSRQLMNLELSGTTIAGSAHDDSGMLGEQQLNAVERFGDMEAERSQGREPVLHGATRPTGKALIGNKRKLTK